MGKKYIIKYKEIVNGNPNLTIQDIFGKLPENDSYIHIENKVSHSCLFKCIKKDEHCYFGIFADLKDFISQNSSAVINDVEYFDGKFKYSVYFLADFDKKILVYIYNNNAQCFANALRDFIQEKANITFFDFADIKRTTFEEKIKSSKKIKSIVVTRRDQNSFKLIGDEFTEFDIENIEFKFKLNKEQSVNFDRIIQYRNKHKNDNEFALEYIAENDETPKIIGFVENFFFKFKKIELESDQIRNADFILEKLKEVVEDYEK